MGALQSIREIHESLPDVGGEDKTVNTSSSSTPDRPINKRLLSLDPRSPSENIERTPIIVERTPMPGAAQQTPVPGARIDDPRSPTVEFTRTPINPCLAAERQSSRLQPLALDSRPSTVTLGSESGIESADSTPVKDALPAECVESPDSAYSAGEAHSEGKPANEEADSSTATASSLEGDTTDKTPLVSGHTVSAEVGNTPKLPLLRARPQALSKLGRMVAEGGKVSDSPAVTRSPLSNVANARTGLSLQQNKTRPLDIEDQPVGRSVVSAGIDKENLFR
ncbi:cell division cycle-associated protein 3 [Elysia marginata]|uniref:Cell division cycle-associated protein 3 n=1 Tax=Elysia marginata TaxID=1093978 RepID=A0AAV4G855_9GAST|nr:cell division cycle-associated protein 3 [Elysia marginata]